MGLNGFLSLESSLGLIRRHRVSCSSMDNMYIRTRYVHMLPFSMYTVDTLMRTAFLVTSSYAVTS